MTYRLSVELIRLDVELPVSACELILILNAQVIFIFRKPKLNASDSDKPIFKLSK